MTGGRSTVRITKGTDPYLAITALSDYARQRGWSVQREIVEISLPTEKELEQFLQEMKDGKIRVINGN